MTKKKKVPLIFISVGVAVIIILFIIVLNSGNGNKKIIRAEVRDLMETVKISGSVQADTVAELGFETSGTVKNVYGKVNDKVKAGQSIANLNLGTLPADLKSAEAELMIKKANAVNDSISLENIKKQQDTLVINAYEELLSDDLVAEPSGTKYTQTPPVISGRYSGKEGRYVIDITPGNSSSIHKIRTFELEDTEAIEISKTSQTRLGTRGLFIDFPDTLSDYDNTIWYVDIPNIKSSSYSANLSAYKKAVYDRNKAIQDAEADLRAKQNGTSISNAEIIKAEAAVERIRAQISDRTLIAPFAGTITRVDINPGEIINANQSVVSIISEGKLGVEIDLPEIDSIKVMIGDKAEIKLDAFGDNIFKGTVESVNRSETIVDGIPVYEARIVIDEQVKDIFSGMTADVTIITEEKESALSLPLSAISLRKDGSHFVRVINEESGKEEEATVEIGIESTDGFVEIISGITENSQILID